VVQFTKEASQTLDYCVAKGATHRAARPDPSLRKERLLRMTSKLHHYHSLVWNSGPRYPRSSSAFPQVSAGDYLGLTARAVLSAANVRRFNGIQPFL
jgi:hypothetical protein